MPYIPFTDEQKVLANSVDLEQFLRMRGEKLERVGREHKLIYYDSSGKHDSITLRGSTWFDHKNQVGSGAIKFMQEFYDMDFQTSVQELLGQTVTPFSYSPPKAIAKEEKKEFRLPEANANMHRVYAYLIKQRFIAPDIISHFAKQHTLYEDKEYHNAVFVGTDENGIPRQAHKRSTSTFGNAFRITCEGSDTKYSFAHFGKSKKLFVFEAPIDMIVMKTGTHPMISKLKLFFKWGIKFEEEYRLPDKTARHVSYKERDELIKDIEVKYPQKKKATPPVEIEIAEDEEFEDEPLKKTSIKTNGS